MLLVVLLIASGTQYTILLSAGREAYSSRSNRTYLRRRGITAVIPDKADQRNTVERYFQRLKTWRGLATRYDKSPEGYQAGLPSEDRSCG